MGNSNWDAGSYHTYARTVACQSQQQIFTNTSGCHADLDPSKFVLRESADSPANPAATPVVIGVDETGSMGHLATSIIKEGLGIIVEGILDRKPITDPHILLAAVGDAYVDSAPIQTTQFEADTVIIEQISKFFIEGNGGGNGGESYPLVWYFALHKTSCDAINKRQRKGYLFTVGDEAYHADLKKEHISRFLAVDVETDVQVEVLLQECLKNWEVFHLITPTFATESQRAVDKWRELLGERAIVVRDWRKLAEVVVSVLQVNEGANKQDVIASWDGETNAIVAAAIESLPSPSNKSFTPSKNDTEIVSI